MKLISLSQGLFAKVDDSEYEAISHFKWSAMRVRQTFYAVRRENGRLVLMHRWLLKANPGSQIDHRDVDGLNNQKENLRFANHAQNQWNRRKMPSRCAHKGLYVRFGNAGPRYMARIKVNGQTHRLGTFDNPIAAAIAYDIAAKKFFGEFARTNF